MPLPPLQQAVFRRVVFSVASSEDDSGRRVSIDPLPGRDMPITADFGKEPHTFDVEAFVVGPDYIDRARALVEACADREGFGFLLLPEGHGGIVRCLRCRRRHAHDERGHARFQLTFVEGAKELLPLRRTSGTQALKSAADDTTRAGMATMVAGVKTVGVPAAALKSATHEISALGQALSVLGTVSGAAEKATALSQRAQSLIRDAQDLALEPIVLAETMKLAIEGVVDTVGDAIASLNAYRDLEALRPQIHLDYLSNQNALFINGAMRRAALAGWANAAAVVDWPSYDAAIAARDAINAAIDDQSLTAGDDDFSSLQALRSRVSAQVPPPDKKLPRLRTLSLNNSISSLTLAYRLYDDTTRDQEIVDRNRVVHPAFLPANVQLQVLSRA